MLLAGLNTPTSHGVVPEDGGESAKARILAIGMCHRYTTGD